MLRVDTKISVEELRQMSKNMFGGIVKAVVDIEKEIMIVDADLSADQEQVLLEEGFEQKNLWGINFHPEKFGSEQFVEFDSMINLRPSWGNLSRGVDDPELQKRIMSTVSKLVTK